MAASLISVGASNIGTADTLAYTVPTGKSTMLLGCAVTNVFGAIVPVSAYIKRGNSIIHLAKDRRVAVGKSEEIVSGKVVLASNDKLYLKAATDSAFDALVSLAEGV